MSVITVFSAKGAPGGTTAAMLLASLWPRPVLLADCDPAGGDIGMRLPRDDGRPLDLNQGLLQLLPLARRGLSPEVVMDHAQAVLGGGEVLVGLTGPEQASAGGPVWQTIAEAFATLPERDVVVDAGRLDPRSPVLPLVARADLAVCVISSTLPSTYSGRARLRSLVPALTSGGAGPRIGLLVRADDKRAAQDAAQVIAEEFPHVVVLGHLSEDPRGAAIFDGRPLPRPERTLLVRSAAGVVEAVLGELARVRLSRTDVAAQPWNTLTGEYAAYLPYLAPETAQPVGARSRLEERGFGQRRRPGRRRRSERAAQEDGG